MTKPQTETGSAMIRLGQILLFKEICIHIKYKVKYLGITIEKLQYTMLNQKKPYQVSAQQRFNFLRQKDLSIIRRLVASGRTAHIYYLCQGGSVTTGLYLLK